MTIRRHDLSGKVALVAGATRGAGRGIAVELGAAGAIVYCSGRSSRAAKAGEKGGARSEGGGPFELAGRPETIEETAELVTAAGGTGIACLADHRSDEAVRALVGRIEREQGRLDVLVNDIWGGDELTEWGQPFWELDLDKGFRTLDLAVGTHVRTSRLAAPLMLRERRGPGLIVEVTDGDSLFYRGTLFYDLAKTAAIRLAFGMAEDLREKGIAAIAVTPGFLRSEAMLEHFGVTEATWREGVAKDPNFLYSETPRYVGRGVAALAADPGVMEKSGSLRSSWGLAKEYGLSDVDGQVPDWGAHARTQDFGEQQRDSHRRFVGVAGP